MMKDFKGFKKSENIENFYYIKSVVGRGKSKKTYFQALLEK